MEKKFQILLAVVCLAITPFVLVSPAAAVPSFARQTGLACNACHTAYPQLNAFGREFKLNGYTFSGGSTKFPPLAAMLQPSFTHTSKAQSSAPTRHFGDNDNAALQQVSLFYGGAISDHLGAFSQITFDGVGRTIALDNTDVRYARTTTLGGEDIVVGATVNNNPTVQDLWNSSRSRRPPRHLSMAASPNRCWDWAPMRGGIARSTPN